MRLAIGVFVAGTALAQTAPSFWTRWGTDISFLGDGYADLNFDNPACGWNALRNFDMRSNTAHLDMAMMSSTTRRGRSGFTSTSDSARRSTWYTRTDRAPNQLQHVEQAYVSFKPKSWHGLEVDAGEFVTAAGAEIFQSNLNWNYSRSLLFAEAIPYYHFGLRTLFPVGKHFTAGVQVVNGWNNVKDTHDTGKTVGLTGAYTGKRSPGPNAIMADRKRTHQPGPPPACTTARAGISTDDRLVIT